MLDTSQAAGPAGPAAPAAPQDQGGRRLLSPGGTPSPRTPLASPPQSGLRERKKARTRASLREHALRLFRLQGYQATTVEQIAAAAEVSPSTFFRYFPTKEDLVLQDDMDTRMIAAFERQPGGLSPLGAVRAAIREMIASYSQADVEVLRETTALTMTVPEIRARAL